MELGETAHGGEDRFGMQNRRSSFEFEDLLACGRGEMFAGGPQLPLPPMLMFERISEISERGGQHGRGLARAGLDFKPALWVFPCHVHGVLNRAIRSTPPYPPSWERGRLAGIEERKSGRGDARAPREKGREGDFADLGIFQETGTKVMRRVVVTGMGIVSSIGNNTQEVLASLREAKSGISRSDKYAELGFRCQVHGAPTLDPPQTVDRRAMRFLGTAAPWNHVAMEQALREAGLYQNEISHERIGIIMGSAGR